MPLAMLAGTRQGQQTNDALSNASADRSTRRLEMKAYPFVARDWNREAELPSATAYVSRRERRNAFG